MGINAKVTKDVKVSLGLASGGEDPRTTNQTFENSFDTPDLHFDYFFAEYKASKNATVIGGRFPRGLVLWHPSDLLWDVDIRTEGAGVTFNFGSFFLNAAGFVLDENKNASDPTMAAIQYGVNIPLGKVSIKGAISNYVFGGIKRRQRLDFSSESNSTSNVSDPTDLTKIIDVLTFDYDGFVQSLEVTVQKPFDNAIPSATLFGEHVNSFNASDKNTGFLVGASVGHKKVKNKKDWNFTYLYRKLEKDAFLDVLPDSDFAGGKTGYKRHEVIVQLGLKKNVVLGLDYYRTKEIDGRKKEEVVQIDLLLRF